MVEYIPKEFAQELQSRLHSKHAMVFDWIKAATIIRDQQPTIARAGLRDDWKYTRGTIWRDGKPTLRKDKYTFLAYLWATTVLKLNSKAAAIECYQQYDELPNYDQSTFWPVEALAIVGVTDPNEIKKIQE